METNNAVKMIQSVFDDMDKDFTIWEYREEIKALLKCGYFVSHIEEHLTWFPNTEDRKVMCKICNKDIDTIDKETNGGKGVPPTDKSVGIPPKVL